MSCNTFRIGAVYCASPALVGQRQRLVIPIGRQGSSMQVALVSDFSMVNVEISGDFGREFARLKLPDGVYSFSSACEAPAAEYARVRQLLGEDD